MGTPGSTKAGTETLNAGAFIINMGVSPQTFSNGLVPYGMVYDLMINYQVPIKWVIEPAKSKDGTDFTYNGTAYKGGPFIIPVEYITATVSSRISYWQTKGVVGVYTTSSINVPVYTTLTSFPRIIIDTVSKNEDIIMEYLNNAQIPSTAYEKGSPSIIQPCHDLWVNPHGDPTWSSHGYLYNLATVTKSSIWMECHAVSVTEGVQNPSSPFQRLNFLTTNGLKCYSNGKCGSATETHAGNPTAPFTHNFPSDPVMQFIGTMDGATDGGSEKWYQPQSTGAWRSTTKRLVTTANGTSPNEGILMAYGPAFGDTTNGLVMYEGGHNLNGNGTTAERVAGQRAFFNFALLAGKSKQLDISNVQVPSTFYSQESKSISLSVSGGSPGYTYTWSSTIGGTFSDIHSPTTTFKAPNISSSTTGIIKCNVVDYCNRQNFVTRPIQIYTTLPVTLKSFTGKFVSDRIDLTWIVASEINNEYFTVERSFDGVNYSEIGRVSGSKNSTSDKKYTYTDYAPGESKNYYRLKQTDYDGTSKTFDPIFVKVYFGNGYKNKIQFAPNPFSDKVKMDYYSENSGNVEVTLMDHSGTIIRKEIIACKEGMNTVQFFGLSDLEPGIFYAILIRDNEKEIIKLMKY
jgi:hypothetical protein